MNKSNTAEEVITPEDIFKEIRIIYMAMGDKLYELDRLMSKKVKKKD